MVIKELALLCLSLLQFLLLNPAAQKLERVDARESKLDYEEITPCLKEVTKVWEQMINCENRSTTKFSLELLTKAVSDGMLLRNSYPLIDSFLTQAITSS